MNLETLFFWDVRYEAWRHKCEVPQTHGDHTMARSYSHSVRILHEPRAYIFRSYCSVGEGGRLARKLWSVP